MAAEVVFTKSDEFVIGNKRAIYGNMSLSGLVSGAFATGLEVVDYVSVTPISVDTTDNAHFVRNTGSGATAINGELRIVSGTDGDSYEVFMFGR